MSIMIRTALIAALVSFAAPAAAQNDAAAREFAEQAIAQMQEAMPDANFEMEPGEPLQINVANTPHFEEGAINLHRVYGFCQEADKKACMGELRGLISLAMQEKPQSGADNLRIIVRDAAYWGYVVETLPGEALPQHRQIGEDLYAILAIDSPTSIAIASPSTIAEIGLEPEAAWELAAEQTRAAIPPLPDPAAMEEQLFAYEGEEYMASILFDIEAWAAIAETAGPDLMITAVSEQFVITGLIPDENLDGMKEAVLADCNSAPRCISPHVYRFRGGMWVIAD